MTDATSVHLWADEDGEPHLCVPDETYIETPPIDLPTPVVDRMRAADAEWADAWVTLKEAVQSKAAAEAPNNEGDWEQCYLLGGITPSQLAARIEGCDHPTPVPGSFDGWLRCEQCGRTCINGTWHQ